MTQETWIYDSSTEFLVKLLECDPSKVRVLCPHCSEELVFAPTWELANKLAVHPGIYCLKDEQHVFAMFELRPPVSE